MKTMVLPGRVPVKVTLERVHQVLGLSNVGAVEPQSAYTMEKEMVAMSSMHQVKDYQNAKCRL